MNVLGVGAPAPASLSSSALHFRLKVTNILPPSPIYHSRTVHGEELANTTRSHLSSIFAARSEGEARVRLFIETCVKRVRVESR